MTTARGWRPSAQCAPAAPPSDCCPSHLARDAQFGYTALVYAARAAQLDIVRTLLSAGADVEAGRGKPAQGLLPSAGAAVNNHIETNLHPFLGRLSNAWQRQLGPKLAQTANTPLHCAADVGALDVVRLLVRSGANMEARNAFGHTPLMLASKGGHVQVVGHLLSLGARHDPVSRSGQTALDKAAHGGHLEVQTLLINSAGKPPPRAAQPPPCAPSPAPPRCSGPPCGIPRGRPWRAPAASATSCEFEKTVIWPPRV